MPIRFRCAYCNQLMGIATRKAGTIIRCPKCSGEIIVPTPEHVSPERRGNAVNAAFEDREFDRLLQPSATAPATPTPTPEAQDNAFLLGAERTFGPQALSGVFVSTRALVLAVLVLLVLLLLVFAAGFVVGKNLQ
jgi:phage FluMu protein Com